MDTSYFIRFLISALIGALLCIPVAAQTQNKLIVWKKEPGRGIKAAGTPGGQSNALAQFDDFEIEEILVEGKSIIIGQPFSASDDWLNAIKVRIKNVSQKKFQFIQITLGLPQIMGGPIIPVCFGCALADREKGIAPGEEVELQTVHSEKFYDWVKTSISAKTSLSSISTAQIEPTLAILSDGTQLISDCVKTANTQKPCPRDPP
jgi:hypothetical protein